ncbi:DoxX family membrane protein [Candidatus Uhrbacteria bacterium]|jgi:putative oxidoreductase|nr:DoxX family membrane protein [Candidatus Uhrbacteria bacterium]
MLESFLAYGDAGIVILRFAVGFIFLYHGIKKWTMPPVKGMMKNMMSMLKFLEPVVGLLLIVGLYSQLMALIIIILMIGAIVLKISMMKIPFASMKATGWEFDLILLAAAIVLLVSGAGPGLF